MNAASLSMQHGLLNSKLLKYKLSSKLDMSTLHKFSLEQDISAVCQEGKILLEAMVRKFDSLKSCCILRDSPRGVC